MIATIALLAYLAAFAVVLAYGPTRHDRALSILFRPLITLVAFVALWAIFTGIRPAQEKDRYGD